MKKKVFEYFPHPVFHYKVENYAQHNEELSNYIYDLQSKDTKGLKKSNINGWHSSDFDLKNKQGQRTNSYLPHSVLPNESEEDRIVVSFNLWIGR